MGTCCHSCANSKVWAVVARLCDLARRRGSHFSTPSGARRCRWRRTDRMVQTSLLYLRFGAPGLLFDQEYGLLAYAPVYVLAGTGLWQMWRAGGELRRQASRSRLIFGALLVTVGAFRIWWGGSAAPARPMASGLLLLMLPIAVRSGRRRPDRRAAPRSICCCGSASASRITLAVAQDGLLISNGRDGTSALLDCWSPRWELWTLAPTFVRQQWAIAWLLTTLWLAVAGGAAFLLSRTRSSRAGASALFAFLTFGIALLAIAIAAPLAAVGPHRRARRSISARGRGWRRSTASMRGPGPHRSSTTRCARAPRSSVAATGARREAAAANRPAAGARAFTTAASRCRPAPTTSRCSSTTSCPREPHAAVAADRPHRSAAANVDAAAASRAAVAHDVVAAGGCRLRRPARTGRDRARDRRDHHHTPAVVDAGARPLVPVVLAAGNYAGATFYFHNEQLYPEPQASGRWAAQARRSPSRLRPATPRR